MISVSRDPLAARLVEDARAAAERAVRRDGEVVGVLVDQDEAAELADPARVARHEPIELLAGADEEIRSLDVGVPREVGEQGVAARLHCPASYRWTLSSGPIRSRRNIEWWRSIIHSEPRWAIDWIPVSASIWSRTP